MCVRCRKPRTVGAYYYGAAERTQLERVGAVADEARIAWPRWCSIIEKSPTVGESSGLPNDLDA